MNGKRILLGGLLAGLIINIGETILNIPVIGTELDAALQALGVQQMSGATIGLFVLMCLGLGILCTWLYAAIRPRFGAGARTAVLAGLIVWLMVSVWANVASAAMGLFPPRILAIVMAWQLFEIPLATLAGAYLYREEPIEVEEPVPAVH